MRYNFMLILGAVIFATYVYAENLDYHKTMKPFDHYERDIEKLFPGYKKRTAEKETQDNEMQRFALWTRCASLNLDVNVNTDFVNTEAIKKAVMARIYPINIISDPKSHPQRLVISINVGKNGFKFEPHHEDSTHVVTYRVVLTKPLKDYLSNVSLFSEAWGTTRSSLLMKGSATSGAIAVISGLLDGFIVEYLQVNAPFCGNKDAPRKPKKKRR